MNTPSPRASRKALTWLRLLISGAALVFLLLPAHVEGFALLGPYADWMDRTNSYRWGWEIGGPVDIGEEYRWNTPVVTYGFDQSFLDYFGSNGVNAVEQAIQVFNDLPAASALVISNYPSAVGRMNYLAQSRNLCDLKTAAVVSLMEHMGLAESARSIFVLHRWDPVFLSAQDELNWPIWVIPNYILERNFDPETLAVSHQVNGNLYTGMVAAWWPLNPTPRLAYVDMFLIDPAAGYTSAVAEWTFYYRPFYCGLPGVALSSAKGLFCKGLTGDDVGGLRYLLSPTNINLETLLPDVHGGGTNASDHVDLALRPGVDKITFVRQNVGLLGQFLPVTNQYTDTYITNGVPRQQQLERVIGQPDFLFCAADTSVSNLNTPPVLRSGTSEWWNSAALGGGTGYGPGVIRPPVRITFNKLGTMVQTYEGSAEEGWASVWDARWASFDNTTNLPVEYPGGPGLADTNYLPVHLWLLNPTDGSVTGAFAWQAPVPFGGQGLLQTSTNLTNWVSLTTVNNHGGTVTWWHWVSRPERFFRVAPQ